MNDEELNELKAGIDERTARISLLQDELDALKCRYNESVSRRWAEDNGVTSANVCLSYGVDRPWFGSMRDFWLWMQETGRTEPWVEWDGRIYPRDEMNTDKQHYESCCLAEYVPS